MLKYSDDMDRFYAQCTSDVNSDFVNRQKSVFEKLDAVVKIKEDSLGNRNNYKRSSAIDKTVIKRQKSATKQFRGQESIFKRPEAPLPARLKTKIPDFKIHPHNWTKYNLSDVSEEDMSDHSNTAAAMSFLQEIRARKEIEQMDVDCRVKAITFSKPSCRKQIEDGNQDTKLEKSVFRCSKVIMPEYVVGKKQMAKKNIYQSSKKHEKYKEIKLDHLEEEDDE